MYHFLITNDGLWGIVTSDGKLCIDDPKVRGMAIKSVEVRDESLQGRRGVTCRR